MNDVKPARWAHIWTTPEFVQVETYSGYRSSRPDPKGVNHFLPTSVNDTDLGAALFDALSHSRFVLHEAEKLRTGIWIHPDVEFDAELYDYNLMIERLKLRESRIMQLFKYKTKRAMYKEMKSCPVEEIDGNIIITPLHHEKRDLWLEITDTGPLEKVLVPSGSTPDVVGAAIRVALSRCTDARI